MGVKLTSRWPGFQEYEDRATMKDLKQQVTVARERAVGAEQRAQAAEQKAAASDSTLR